jgi:flagellar protein FliS
MNASHAPKFAANTAANAYARVGIDTAAMSASPTRLIMMLFDGAKAAIIMARHHMANREIVAKGNAISKAINIIDNGLKAGLDAEAGGQGSAELVANLSGLYDYITQRLLYANLRNDPEFLNEAERLLDNLSSAWAEISPEGKSRDAASDAPAAASLSIRG